MASPVEWFNKLPTAGKVGIGVVAVGGGYYLYKKRQAAAAASTTTTATTGSTPAATDTSSTPTYPSFSGGGGGTPSGNGVGAQLLAAIEALQGTLASQSQQTSVGSGNSSGSGGTSGLAPGEPTVIHLPVNVVSGGGGSSGGGTGNPSAPVVQSQVPAPPPAGQSTPITEAIGNLNPVTTFNPKTAAAGAYYYLTPSGTFATYQPGKSNLTKGTQLYSQTGK